jgi:aminoglycoside phosphotransferase
MNQCCEEVQYRKLNSKEQYFICCKNGGIVELTIKMLLFDLQEKQNAIESLSNALDRLQEKHIFKCPFQEDLIND